ncbi:uncharacterized protein LOC110115735, partial [Dendrobium catenatum]|uniref:uncharacterized protein LOC110115735 n=1 Tax=Dendrobium catenatum TaxID=906689 RepID=UPI0010A04427
MASRGNRDDREESDEETDDEDYAPDDEETEEEYEEAEAVVVESPEIEILVVPAGGGDVAGEGGEDEGEEEEEEEVVVVEEPGCGIGRGRECEESSSGTEGQLQAGSDPSCLPSCPICLVPWTPDGPHRVCCIPCGHVYGRSCLEKWIKQCKKSAAKCPQCSARFKQTEMINLYAPLIAITNTDLEKEVLSLREKNESLKLEVSFRIYLISIFCPNVPTFRGRAFVEFVRHLLSACISVADPVASFLDAMRFKIDNILPNFRRLRAYSPFRGTMTGKTGPFPPQLRKHVYELRRRDYGTKGSLAYLTMECQRRFPSQPRLRKDVYGRHRNSHACRDKGENKQGFQKNYYLLGIGRTGGMSADGGLGIVDARRGQ